MVVSVSNIGHIIVDAFRSRTPRTAAAWDGRPVDIFVNGGGGTDNVSPQNASYESMYRYQPHLRTAIDFLACNIAQLSIHSFKRGGDGSRSRETESLAHVRLSRNPNRYMTGYELIYSLVADMALYNRAYWFFAPGEDGVTEIHPFPAGWVSPVFADFSTVDYYSVKVPGGSEELKISPDNCVAFNGWSPGLTSPSSPADSLRLVLEENYHSRKYRVQFWRNHGRVGTYLSRPVNAPDWDNSARRRFYSMWEDFTSDTGARAGSTPLLEDGIEIKSNAFKSADEEWADSVRLGLQTVAQVYQIPPGMIGADSTESYGSLKERNRMLFKNTLGSRIRFIEDRINAFVLPLLGVDNSEYFVEFNTEGMLRGDFETQAAIMSTATGGAWMTRNESRALMNLPPLDMPGADELITPLNVVVGGQTSPQDGGTAFQGGGKNRTVILKFLERCDRIKTARGIDDMPWDRLTRELTDDLGGNAEFAKGITDALAKMQGGAFVDMITAFEEKQNDHSV